MNLRKISVRFDDVCPTMNYEKFEIANQKLRLYGIKPLLGIVPYCKDEELMIETPHEDFWEYMRSLKAEGYSIAMHGYTHVCDSSGKGIVSRGRRSEFAGYPYDIQYEKIKKGKKIMERNGVDTTIFFAPAHSYDKNTLKALASNGFKYISDGKSNKSYRQNGIECIPCRYNGLPRIGNRGYYLVPLHTSQWVLSEKEINEINFLKICDTYHKDMINYSEFMEQKIGNIAIQKLSEKWNILWDTTLRPTLSLIYQRVKNKNLFVAKETIYDNKNK